MEKYIDYLLTTIITDVEAFNHWWMLLIIPAVVYFVVLILKYFLLTMPIWLPFTIISAVLKDIFRNGSGN